MTATAIAMHSPDKTSCARRGQLDGKREDSIMADVCTKSSKKVAYDLIETQAYKRKETKDEEEVQLNVRLRPQHLVGMSVL